jgi:RNA polymerase sigma-70 factor (ECF subfamily)
MTSPTASSESTSTRLLARIRNNESDAWRRLVESYGPLVYGWARQAGLQASDAADVMQEAFRSVAAAIGSFERSDPGDSFRGWLWTITRNKIRDHFRKLALRKEAQGTNIGILLAQLPDAAPEDRTGAGQVEGSQVRLVRTTLESVQNEFEPRSWQAFWRVAVEGQSASEVAAELSMSVGALYVAKSRILRRLREELGGFFGPEESASSP